MRPWKPFLPVACIVSSAVRTMSRRADLGEGEGEAQAAAAGEGELLCRRSRMRVRVRVRGGPSRLDTTQALVRGGVLSEQRAQPAALDCIRPHVHGRDRGEAVAQAL